MDLEFNKIAAAILTAGIIAMVSGIIAGALVHPKLLAKPVYVVVGVEAPAAASAAGAAAQGGPEPIASLLASAPAALAVFPICWSSTVRRAQAKLNWRPPWSARQFAACLN